MQGAPLAVWVVHPATGTVDAVVIEDGAFPAGFLADGRFVALARDTATHVSFVRLYAPQREPDGQRRAHAPGDVAPLPRPWGRERERVPRRDGGSRRVSRHALAGSGAAGSSIWASHRAYAALKRSHRSEE